MKVCAVWESSGFRNFFFSTVTAFKVCGCLTSGVTFPKTSRGRTFPSRLRPPAAHPGEVASRQASQEPQWARHNLSYLSLAINKIIVSHLLAVQTETIYPPTWLGTLPSKYWLAFWSEKGVTQGMAQQRVLPSWQRERKAALKIWPFHRETADCHKPSEQLHGWRGNNGSMNSCAFKKIPNGLLFAHLRQTLMLALLSRHQTKV